MDLSLTVAQTLKNWPAVTQIFLKHRMACLGCCMASFDTLADAAHNYQLVPIEFEQELERATRPQLSSTHPTFWSNPMPDSEPRCVACQRSSQEIPLIALTYQNQTYWICPQHLPILLHKPEQLIGLLPGAENLQPHKDEG